MVAITGVDKDGSARQAGLIKDRIKVNSVSTSEVLFAVEEGRGFQTYTQEIVLTGTDKLMVFYFKNMDDNPILITSATIGSGVTAGGTDNGVLIEQVGNISPADDIVTAGTDIISTNRKNGDPRQFVGIIKKGPQAVSGNEFPGSGVLSDVTKGRTFDLSVEIPKGGDVGISLRPPAGNTSITVTISVSFHLIDDI